MYNRQNSFRIRHQSLTSTILITPAEHCLPLGWENQPTYLSYYEYLVDMLRGDIVQVTEAFLLHSQQLIIKLMDNQIKPHYRPIRCSWGVRVQGLVYDHNIDINCRHCSLFLKADQSSNVIIAEAYSNLLMLQSSAKGCRQYTIHVLDRLIRTSNTSICRTCE